MSKHVVDPLTERVTHWYVSGLPLEAQDRASTIVAESVRLQRERDGLVPHGARPPTLLCGCPASAPVDADGACPRCSP